MPLQGRTDIQQNTPSRYKLLRDDVTAWIINASYRKIAAYVLPKNCFLFYFYYIWCVLDCILVFSNIQLEREYYLATTSFLQTKCTNWTVGRCEVTIPRWNTLNDTWPHCATSDEALENQPMDDGWIIYSVSCLDALILRLRTRLRIFTAVNTWIRALCLQKWNSRKTVSTLALIEYYRK